MPHSRSQIKLLAGGISGITLDKLADALLSNRRALIRQVISITGQDRLEEPLSILAEALFTAVPVVHGSDKEDVAVNTRDKIVQFCLVAIATFMDMFAEQSVGSAKGSALRGLIAAGAQDIASAARKKSECSRLPSKIQPPSVKDLIALFRGRFDEELRKCLMFFLSKCLTDQKWVSVCFWR